MNATGRARGPRALTAPLICNCGRGKSGQLQGSPCAHKQAPCVVDDGIDVSVDVPKRGHSKKSLAARMGEEWGQIMRGDFQTRLQSCGGCSSHKAAQR